MIGYSLGFDSFSRDIIFSVPDPNALAHVCSLQYFEMDDIKFQNCLRGWPFDKLVSKYYKVSTFSDETIVLDPLVEHNSTLVMLHGWSEDSIKYFHEFKNGNLAPLSTRIIIP
jgi:hypothetical protein